MQPIPAAGRPVWVSTPVRGPRTRARIRATPRDTAPSGFHHATARPRALASTRGTFRPCAAVCRDIQRTRRSAPACPFAGSTDRSKRVSVALPRARRWERPTRPGAVQKWARPEVSRRNWCAARSTANGVGATKLASAVVNSDLGTEGAVRARLVPPGLGSHRALEGIG
jgi:hypothetical protein